MLAWFRRHAKILMVVLGSAAMAIFGLGPVFDTLASRGRGEDPREKEVVATWKGGEITRIDLDRMEVRHFQTLRFLNGVQQAAEKKKGDVVNSLVIPISPIQDGKREMVDAQLISRFLMAERAKEEGMLVSDDMVKEYIALLSDDAGFSQRDLDAINDVANNKYCSFNSVRERLKTELLANQMQLCCMTAVPIIPNPVESVELYRRTMEQIECQILPIEVAKYIGRVQEEPSPADIKKLYEEGKYNFPDVLGERPGFKVGRKVNLQYFIADYQTYLQNEMNKLSDEDVQKEYDRLVEAMDESVLEPLKVDDGAIEINDPPPAESGVEPPPGDNSGENTDSPDAPNDVTPPPTEPGKTTADKKTADENDESNKSSQPGDDTPEKSSSEPEKTEGTDAKSNKENSDQSYNVVATKDQFVSTTLQEESQPGKKAAESEAGTQSNDPANPATAKSDQEPEAGDSKTADPESAAAKTGDAEPAAQEPGGIDDAMKAAAEDAANQDEAATKVDRVAKPLKDVVEEVKTAMCQEATQEAMNRALTKASVIVQDHFEQRLRWKFDNESKELEEPAPLDIQEIAAKYNLIAKETGLVDADEIVTDQCAQVREFMQYTMQGRQVPQLVPVGQIVFDDFSDLELYEAKTIDDNWGSKSSFLYWLAEKSEIKIPTLEEATPTVVEFWKKKQALELAMEEAESIKTKVNQSGGKKMSELYADRVSDTGAFTWFSSFGSTRYSSPIGVTSPGEEFMKTAFSLGKMEAGVAENMPQDTIYVIQSQSEPKSIEEIGSDYLVNQFFKFKRIPNEVQQVSQVYFQEFNYDWRLEFEDMMGLKYMDR